VAHSWVGYWPYPQTFDQAGKAFQRKTPELIRKILNYGCKKYLQHWSLARFHIPSERKKRSEKSAV
jgi:hypothetical protein